MTSVLLPALAFALSFPACAAATPERPAGEAAERPAPLAELEGSSWRLAAWSPDERAASRPEITLAFAARGISGSSGCNLYAATITEEAPGEVEISALTSSDRPCFGPMAETDSRFVAALTVVARIAFAGDRLVLSGTATDGTAVRLEFERGSES